MKGTNEREYKDLIKSEALFFGGWVLFLFAIKFYVKANIFTVDFALRVMCIVELNKAIFKAFSSYKNMKNGGDLLLSIGEFSNICEAYTKTLRYYDEIGLINPENGYRYYSIRQLKKMLFINRLKSYHFSLEEIKAILELEEDQSEEKLCFAINRKRSEIREKLNAFEYALKQMSYEYNPAGNDTEFAIPIEETVNGMRDLLEAFMRSLF